MLKEDACGLDPATRQGMKKQTNASQRGILAPASTVQPIPNHLVPPGPRACVEEKESHLPSVEPRVSLSTRN